MDIILRRSLPKLREKLLEALQAVLPIVAIVLVLCFTVAPVSPSILLCFLLGAAMIVVGIMFFTLGAEMSMTPMGERVGAVITRSRKLPLILVLGFLLGFLITISEPDLQVLADQVPSIPSGTLILSVAAGVGLFLVFAFLLYSAYLSIGVINTSMKTLYQTIPVSRGLFYLPYPIGCVFSACQIINVNYKRITAPAPAAEE